MRIFGYPYPLLGNHPAAFHPTRHDIRKRIRLFVLVKTQASGGRMTEPMTPTTLFKCLADDTRAKISLLVVREGELCVCELTAALDLSQPKISRHLALLRSAGLLLDRRQGQWVYYRLNPDVPAWVAAVLKAVADANQPWLETEAKRLCCMSDRPINQAMCS
jgi:DNA-binding transcriptional ArsR family regulator